MLGYDSQVGAGERESATSAAPDQPQRSPVHGIGGTPAEPQGECGADSLTHGVRCVASLPATGPIRSRPVLSGLHHVYERAA